MRFSKQLGTVFIVFTIARAVRDHSQLMSERTFFRCGGGGLEIWRFLGAYAQKMHIHCANKIENATMENLVKRAREL